jgi:hypothetical protein
VQIDTTNEIHNTKFCCPWNTAAYCMRSALLSPQGAAQPAVLSTHVAELVTKETGRLNVLFPSRIAFSFSDCGRREPADLSIRLALNCYPTNGAFSALLLLLKPAQVRQAPALPVGFGLGAFFSADALVDAIELGHRPQPEARTGAAHPHDSH